MTGIRVEHDGPKFAMTPEWLLDAEISDRSVRLWAVLHRYADQQTADAYPSRSSLAKRLRCSVDSIDRAVAELELIGAMTVTRRPTKEGRRHLPSIYHLHFGGSRTTAATSSRTDAATGSRSGAAQNESQEIETQERDSVAVATAAIDLAKSIVSTWWDERKAADNPVGQPYMACAKVVEQMLRNGVPANRVEYALRSAPVVSAGALEMAIQQRLREREQIARPRGFEGITEYQRQEGIA